MTGLTYKWRGWVIALLLIISVLASSSAFSAESLYQLTYDVVNPTTNKHSKAVRYLWIGLITASIAPNGQTFRIRLPDFQSLKISGNRYIFTFKEGVFGKHPYEVTLYDVTFADEFLLKNPEICTSTETLILIQTDEDWDDCPEVKVKEEDKGGDWDPCALGYQITTRKHCARFFGASTAPFSESARMLPEVHLADLLGGLIKWSDPDAVIRYCYMTYDHSCFETLQAFVKGSQTTEDRDKMQCFATLRRTTDTVPQSVASFETDTENECKVRALLELDWRPGCASPQCRVYYTFSRDWPHSHPPAFPWREIVDED